MEILLKPQLETSEKLRVCEIWNNEYPATLNFTDVDGFDEYLNSLSEPNHYLLIDGNAVIQGWACKFIRENAKWFAILLDGKIHGKGHGSQLLIALKKSESELNGWISDSDFALKNDGSIYRSPLDFYLKHKFSLCPDERIETEKVSAVKIFWSQNRFPKALLLYKFQLLQTL